MNRQELTQHLMLKADISSEQAEGYMEGFSNKHFDLLECLIDDVYSEGRACGYEDGYSEGVEAERSLLE